MSVNEVKQSFDKIAGYSDVAKAIEFKQAYKAEHGTRPSLVSVIMLYQSYKARAEKAEADLAKANAQIEEDFTA